jgi:hypothetical protein
MYMREPAGDASRRELASGEALVLATCAAAVLLLGIFPNEPPFEFLSWIRALDWTRQSVALLH